MDGFTSTGLVSLLVRMLQDRAPDLLDGMGRPDPMKHAIEPAGTKERLVARVMEQHGPGLLLSVGHYLSDADETPTLSVLTRSPDPAVLAEKWMRLERYYHATHRTQIAGEEEWVCKRISQGQPATPGENWLIAGLLLGLVASVIGDKCGIEVADAAADFNELKEAPFISGDTAERFRIYWAGKLPSAPLAGVGSDTADSLALAHRLADIMVADIGRSWKVGDAARALALSSRSLQRRLGEEGRNFSGVLRRARMREATRLLTDSDTALSEIGYCCGYADQAHFQRDFLRATNITPRDFRQSFREGASR